MDVWWSSRIMLIFDGAIISFCIVVTCVYNHLYYFNLLLIQDARKLEQLYCDPVQRLVADCMLMDADTAVVSDRKGSVAVLSRPSHLEGILYFYNFFFNSVPHFSVLKYIYNGITRVTLKWSQVTNLAFCLSDFF